MRLGARLASRILGRRVDLVQADESWEFVDPTSGEIVSHLGGRERFFSALLMRAALPSNHVAGVMTHKPKAGSPRPSWAVPRPGNRAFVWIRIG